MKTLEHIIPGDATGHSFVLRSHHFEGGGKGPAVYIQAALHAQELPGLAAIHFLMPMLAKAEAEGRLRSAVTIVPHANPIGLSQGLFNEQVGRFDLTSRINFNRSFPLPGGWTYDAALGTATEALKAKLLALSRTHPSCSICIAMMRGRSISMCLLHAGPPPRRLRMQWAPSLCCSGTAKGAAHSRTRW